MSSNATLFRCLKCGEMSVFSKSFPDGHNCPACGDILTPLRDVYAGVDLAQKRDFSTVREMLRKGTVVYKSEFLTTRGDNDG
jgi:predicted RNA-binding Zn-ribbon protein involved in translation (DUF1610 family)